MTEQHDRKVTLKEFESDVRLIMRLLKTDVWGIQRLIQVAKEELPERDIEIRRELGTHRKISACTAEPPF